MAQTKDILLEIGTEEIPARFIPGVLRDLKSIAESTFKQSNIEFAATSSMATPRRMALKISGVAVQQEDRVREAFGPPKQAAYGPDGALTQAALGFARSQGVAPESLVIKQKGKGEYIAAVIEEKGQPTETLLPEVLKKIVLSLNFPKSMRWGDGTVRFARPIHWIVALFGSDTVRFEIEGIVSGNKSRGHRFLSPDEFVVDTIDGYEKALDERFVVVDIQERMERIRQQSIAIGKESGGEPELDEELLSIVACLVEYPMPVRGRFPSKYLSLPDELLRAVMVGHQKYFPIKDSNGLVDSFVIVSNTRSENAGVISAGAERVIKARFEDARFYYEEDTKVTLHSRLEALKKVTFQEKLGSIYDKSMRVQAVASAIAKELAPSKSAQVTRAAELMKCDLISGVVREFPELQGIMGKYYATNDREDAEVAEAMREQYLPAFSGDRVPATEVGTVIALADRIDNIASFFSIGMKPSGSEDPYALRRQALGIISILTERNIPITLRGLLGHAISNVKKKGPKLESDIEAFFAQRFEALFAGKGYSHDLIQSVLGYCMDMPMSELMGRIDALQAFKKEPAFNEFLVAIKRVRNIVPDTALPQVNESLFKDAAEGALWSAIKTADEAVTSSLNQGDFAVALKALSTLVPHITKFFDAVMVMDKDEAVKGNRLAILKSLWSIASRICDFSKLQEN